MSLPIPTVTAPRRTGNTTRLYVAEPQYYDQITDNDLLIGVVGDISFTPSGAVESIAVYGTPWERVVKNGLSGTFNVTTATPGDDPVTAVLIAAGNANGGAARVAYVLQLPDANMITGFAVVDSVTPNLAVRGLMSYTFALTTDGVQRIVRIPQYNVFTESSTWNWLRAGQPRRVDVLLVGGGGAGGKGTVTAAAAGGGGAGAVRVVENVKTFGDVVAAVGAGGVGGFSSVPAVGSDGSPSFFGNVFAVGGGGGGFGSVAGVSGGSGGGAGGAALGGVNEGGSGVSGQGNDGGVGFLSATEADRAGGGGGGRGAVGEAGSVGVGGDGGAGVTLESLGWGGAVEFGAPAAVGGGGGGVGAVGGSGGFGGGADGGDPSRVGSAGVPNSGGGGGGINHLSTSKALVTLTGDTVVSYVFVDGVRHEVVQFNGSGSIEVANAELNDVEYLIVAGGGGGGPSSIGVFGGGGGAGGMLSNVGVNKISLPIGTHNIVVGAGGIVAGNGHSSSFNSISTVGGGAGGAERNNGAAGGSGGGGGRYNVIVGQSPAPSAPTLGGAGTPGQGFAGGPGISGNNQLSNSGGGGGGGGAGEVGNTDGDRFGGDGLQNSITGADVYYAGGGSGASELGATASGGLGGGGTFVPSTFTGSPGAANTGGGGAGGQVGGSGVVIIRWPEEIVGSGGSGLVIVRNYRNSEE
jgi:hypothetical protein